MSTLIVYKESAAASLPTRGKFVQLGLSGKAYLLFAPKSLHEWHNQIVQHFLDELSLSNQWFGPEHLEIDSDAVTVTGGGRFEVDYAQKFLRLFGASQAYGRFDESTLVQQIASADHPFSDYRLLIED